MFGALSLVEIFFFIKVTGTVTLLPFNSLSENNKFMCYDGQAFARIHN